MGGAVGCSKTTGRWVRWGELLGAVRLQVGGWGGGSCWVQ